MAAARKIRKTSRMRRSRPSRAAAPGRKAAALRANVAEPKAQPQPLIEVDPAAVGISDAVIKAPEAEDFSAPRGRDRSSYDGDTAIKLYLPEIGQVKLLTPQ